MGQIQSKGLKMNRRRTPLLTVAVMALVAIGLAACGGSSNSSDSASAAANTTASGSDTVSTKSISGVGTVLVDSKGNALYTNNQDSGMNVACTGSCTAIWVPLMAPSSGQPTSSDQAVQAKLGMVKSKGGSQVTFGGKPLYTFVQDSPGQVTGNGFTDNFGGTSFTWTVASTGQVSSTATTTSGSSSGGGSSSGSSGGYGY
jgi:predicted lipoprotein with Yx(FWY)xxD motif